MHGHDELLFTSESEWRKRLQELYPQFVENGNGTVYAEFSSTDCELVGVYYRSASKGIVWMGYNPNQEKS